VRKLLRLTAVIPCYPGTLTLTWDDGVKMDVDVSDSMHRHPILRMLAAREVFEDVSVINNGGGVGWANGADFCAQALRMKAEEQAAAKRISA
jgi:hypothetical protein